MTQKKSGDEDGYSYICVICEDFGELLCCERCRQGFHLACLGLKSCPAGDSWLCKDCSQNKVRCFECKEYGIFKENANRCCVGLCGKIYHYACVKEWGRPQPKGSGIVCPHHYCDICWNTRHPRKEGLHRCLKCPTAYHESCMPDDAGLLEDITGYMLCPKHNDQWKCQNEGDAPTSDVAVGFQRLPVPSVPQDFKLPRSIRDAVRRFARKPSPYTHIRRNIYLVKKPRKKSEEENMQCSCHVSDGSSAACDKDCLCGILLTSCSTSCKCGNGCTNLPFQKRPGRKMQAVKTEKCGWGLKADEDIKAGDFLVEYVGEVIDDETCEKRLWAMKEKGESNFYMCEISREMVIDATFKGNLSRFINHSCCPNSELQKWEIEGEIRIGVFAKVDIKKGDYINYDYQFIQFGTDQLCHCGASTCRGQLGKPQKPKVTAVIANKTTNSGAVISKRLRSKLYGSFRIERGYTPINGLFRQQKNSFVVQADLHYEVRTQDNCVGLRVKVWWPLDQKFYHGKIIRYDPTIGKHQIMYDDGQEEDLLMTKERWEVEKTLPFRRKRSALERKRRKSRSLEQERGLSAIMERNRGQSPIYERNRGQSPILEPNRVQSPILQWNRGQSPVLQRNRGQSPILDRNRGHSPMLEQNRTESPRLEQDTCQSQVLEQNRGQSLTLERNIGQSPKLERSRDQSPSLEQSRGQSQTCEQSKSQSPILEQDGGQSPILQQNRGQSPVSKQNRRPSPKLERSRGQSPPSEQIRCQSPISECKAGPLPVLKQKNALSPASEHNSLSTTLEQKQSQSPVCRRTRFKARVVGQKESRPSPVRDGKRGPSPGLEQTGSQSNVLQWNRGPSPLSDHARGNSLVICKRYTRQRVSQRIGKKDED